MTPVPMMIRIEAKKEAPKFNFPTIEDTARELANIPKDREDLLAQVLPLVAQLTGTTEPERVRAAVPVFFSHLREIGRRFGQAQEGAGELSYFKGKAEGERARASYFEDELTDVRDELDDARIEIKELEDRLDKAHAQLNVAGIPVRA